MAQQTEAVRRAPLNRERVLSAAVVLADEAGVEQLSMRKLAQELGVVPMALYKHVANKEELLDGMVDVIVGEVDTRTSGSGWREDVRQRVLPLAKSCCAIRGPAKCWSRGPTSRPLPLTTWTP